ncbi:glucosyl-3-phosphoglycerate synthase [soil metagenome]
MRQAAARIYDHRDFDLAALVAAKGSRTISVCLPARDEAGTVGPIVSAIRRHLVDDAGLVDEILVVDDHSGDDTASVASAAGARVVDAPSLLGECGAGHGKGEALWKSLFAAEGDVIAWCDADIRDFDPRFVVGLVGPLVTHDDIALVKGCYERPLDEGAGGGRVTELVARPLLSLLFPHLAGIVQPLAGEYAGRREVLEQLPFVEGYGVDLGLLIDVAARFGAARIAQVDLGTRRHRNRSLDELGPQALAVLQVALGRAGADVATVADAVTLLRPGREPLEVAVGERPPLVEVASYRRRTA